MKILSIGHAAYDITFPVENFIVENTKNRVNNKIENGGGPACTAAYLLGKWNADVTFLGIVGKDFYGEQIISELESVNVNTKYIEKKENYQTTSSIIINNQTNGSRTILTYRPNTIVMNDVKLDFTPDIILIDGQEYELSKKMIERYPNAISIIDASRTTKEIIELSKIVDYLVCSLNFAEELSQIKTNKEDNSTYANLYGNLEKLFSNNIIVTLEEKGCLYKKDGVIKIMPSLNTNAVDTTGAGDIFHGAFTYGISKKYDIETILKISNIAGAVSTKYIGGRNSVRTLEEMSKYSEIFK
ncbi:MAG: PfkB family carbohydrate kinase [Mycoplasmatota bacterium]